jgi:hypothetical protein
MRTDADDPARVRDPAIELPLSHTVHFDSTTHQLQPASHGPQVIV